MATVAHNFDILETFSRRVRSSVQTRGGEVRLSLQEANELMTVISEIMARNLSLSQVRPTSEAEQPIGVKMDGGKW